MTAIEIGLHGAVVLAAFLQTITGIGFAMIAGPVILLALNDGSAVQVTTLLSLLIAVVLAPGLRSRIDPPMLKQLSIGALAGLPFGIALFALVGVDLLKLIAGLTVGVLTALTLMIRRHEGAALRPASWGDWASGGVSGLFGGCLAMPGPTAAVRMNARNFDKMVTRATILAMFVLVYPLIFAAHALTVGVTRETLITSAILIPSTLAGVVIGHFAAPHVSERLFRNMVLVLLAATSATLLVAGTGGLKGD